ncbi:4-hydroxybenzoate octaprenyltransferase [Methylocella sp. CPCC 101449]|uniref:4-hydroxybenzoate octaprenyltransferase n=1 Tax=Methylocella sp. CPCC 101449 TaxID=2987531 RepID=UPI00288E31A9|nr:4-hydroxybenzoate octaprenyltransferase [Methylocella sp. CPCC 101449]MDT2023993.1 4-hydroxybenzoate octaprenyltransferase [Methylocella sp. CPCC 101449]
MASEPSSNVSRSLPDSVSGSLVLRWAPDAAIPFIQLARIDRPIGWWLVLLPCWWSAALAGIQQGSGPNWWHVLLFLIGAISMRGAGCVYNDIVDRDIDAGVERTRGRPLPSGRVSLTAAVVFLVLLSLIGAAVLLSFNRFAIVTGLASLLIVAIYPFMKRVTSWPQAVLGLAFAWGGLMGWAAAFGSLSWQAVLIYVCAIFWTIGYDTIYALQDARDDAIVGVKSTARLFAQNVRLGVAICYVLALICAALAIAGVHGGVLAWAGWLAFAAHLGWQVSRIERADTRVALMLFRSNRDAGLLFFAGLAADGMLSRGLF